MKKFVLLVFILINLTLFGQETRFSKKALTEDLDSLVSYIEQVHVNPYTCIPRKDFLGAIDQCKHKLTDSTSLLDYYSYISPLISQLNDGHIQLLFPYAEWIKLNPLCFPFQPQITAEGKLISPEYQKELPPNVEIVGIDGISSKQIVNTLTGSISGESVRFRYSLLHKSFMERFGVFYGFKPSHLIQYKSDKGLGSATIASVRLSDLLLSVQKKNKTVRPTDPSQYYTYRDLDGGKTGILNFKVFEDLPLFTHFLDTVFARIQQHKTENLIIDLRENGGGNSALGDELFQYIARTPFAQFGKGTIKYSRLRAKYYSDTRSTGSMKDLTDSLFRKQIAPAYGTTQTENVPLIPLRENPLRFKGNVYLLTSANSFSSASDFAWCFHYFKMGKIVGEVTGGYIVCFGDVIRTSLPVSQLVLGISHKEFYGCGATDKERHGVVPDYKVEADEALEFTLKLINK